MPLMRSYSSIFATLCPPLINWTGWSVVVPAKVSLSFVPIGVSSTVGAW